MYYAKPLRSIRVIAILEGCAQRQTLGGILDGKVIVRNQDADEYSKKFVIPAVCIV